MLITRKTVLPSYPRKTRCLLSMTRMDNQSLNNNSSLSKISHAPAEPTSSSRRFAAVSTQSLRSLSAQFVKLTKLIGYFLVRMSQDKLQAELYQKINENEAILDTLGEPKHITERRRTLEQIIVTLKESLKVL